MAWRSQPRRRARSGCSPRAGAGVPAIDRRRPTSRALHGDDGARASPGRALGLRWEDIDLDHLILHSNVQLQRIHGKYELLPHKTVRSKRTLPLPPSVAEYLLDHQARMQAERQVASEWGNEWNLVFVTETGAPINGTCLTHRFQYLLEQAGLPEIDYHGLRHTTGTFLAYLGVSAPAIRDLLGHTQLSTTDVYLHSIPKEHDEAMHRMDGLLGGREASA